MIKIHQKNSTKRGNPQSFSSVELQCPCRSINHSQTKLLKSSQHHFVNLLSFSNFWGFKLFFWHSASWPECGCKQDGRRDREGIFLFMYWKVELFRVNLTGSCLLGNRIPAPYMSCFSPFQITSQYFLLLTNNRGSLIHSLIHSSVFVEHLCAKHYTMLGTGKTGHFYMINIF